jgi:hypothetical protein
MRRGKGPRPVALDQERDLLLKKRDLVIQKSRGGISKGNSFRVYGVASSELESANLGAMLLMSVVSRESRIQFGAFPEHRIMLLISLFIH